MARAATASLAISNCVLTVEVLEDRSLLSGPTITVLGTASAGGYRFLNFNGPNAGTNVATGSNENGISNSGTAVGFDIATASTKEIRALIEDGALR